jgi:hypothetical protein
MRPSSFADRLRFVAQKIDNSKNPYRELVAEDVKELIQELEDTSITREEMAEICPSCADKMAALGITKVSADAVMRAAVDLPEGWTEASAKKWWNTATKGTEHKKTKCMEKIKGKVSNPGAFCNWLAGIVGYKPSK